MAVTSASIVAGKIATDYQSCISGAMTGATFHSNIVKYLEDAINAGEPSAKNVKKVKGTLSIPRPNSTDGNNYSMDIGNATKTMTDGIGEAGDLDLLAATHDKISVTATVISISPSAISSDLESLTGQTTAAVVPFLGFVEAILNEAKNVSWTILESGTLKAPPKTPLAVPGLTTFS